jgi:hypothetical protein
MKPLKQYATIIEQSWSTPMGNKMIIFKESPTISPCRRVKSDITD